MADSEWICQVCSHANTRSRCINCHYQRSVSDRLSADMLRLHVHTESHVIAAHPWICANCHLYNNADSFMCVTCHLPRPPPDLILPSTSSQGPGGATIVHHMSGVFLPPPNPNLNPNSHPNPYLSPNPVPFPVMNFMSSGSEPVHVQHFNVTVGTDQVFNQFSQNLPEHPGLTAGQNQDGSPFLNPHPPHIMHPFLGPNLNPVRFPSPEIHDPYLQSGDAFRTNPNPNSYAAPDLNPVGPTPDSEYNPSPNPIPVPVASRTEEQGPGPVQVDTLRRRLYQHRVVVRDIRFEPGPSELSSPDPAPPFEDTPGAHPSTETSNSVPVPAPAAAAAAPLPSDMGTVSGTTLVGVQEVVSEGEDHRQGIGDGPGGRRLASSVLNLMTAAAVGAAVGAAGVLAGAVAGRPGGIVRYLGIGLLTGAYLYFTGFGHPGNPSRDIEAGPARNELSDSQPGSEGVGPTLAPATPATPEAVAAGEEAGTPATPESPVTPDAVAAPEVEPVTPEDAATVLMDRMDAAAATAAAVASGLVDGSRMRMTVVDPGDEVLRQIRQQMEGRMGENVRVVALTPGQSMGNISPQRIRDLMLRIISERNQADWQLDTDSMSYEELLNLFGTGRESVQGLTAVQIADIESHLFSSSAETEPCCICLENLISGEIAKKLPACGHIYHVACIDRWLAISGVCPVCRSHLAPN